MLDVPRELVLFVSGLLAAHRREIGTRKGTRRLGCYRQALFALAWFRDKGDIPRPGRGFGLPQSTASRYLDEVNIEVLAARAPGLREQLERARTAPLAEPRPALPSPPSAPGRNPRARRFPLRQRRGTRADRCSSNSGRPATDHRVVLPQPIPLRTAPFMFSFTGPLWQGN
jgi:hypothetical protein